MSGHKKWSEIKHKAKDAPPAPVANVDLEQRSDELAGAFDVTPEQAAFMAAAEAGEIHDDVVTVPDARA